MPKARVLYALDSPGPSARVPLLRRAGYEVAEARSVAELFEALRDELPDVLVLSGLPYHDILDTCARIRRETRTAFVKILVLAGASEQAAHSAMLDAGADVCLTESVGDEVLVSQARALARARLRNLQAQAEIEGRFRTMAMAAPLGLAVLDYPTGRFLFANPAYEDALGYERGGLDGMTAEAVYADTSDRTVLLASLQETGRFDNRAVRLRKRDGGTLWAMASGCVISYEGRAALLGVFSDITQQKNLEQALRHSEETFSTAFHANTSGMAITRLSDGRYLELNDEFVRLAGMSREEALGRTAIESGVYDSPDDRRRLVDLVLRDGVARDQEFRFRRPDGTRWVGLVSSQLTELRGEQVIISSILDISGRKEMEETLRESEEKFRSAFANAAIGMAVTAPGGNFLDCNAEYARITGYSLEELRRVDFATLVHPDDRQANVEVTRQMLDGEIPGFVTENRYVRKDGQPIWVRKSVSLARRASGEPWLVIALVEDVTRRVKTEATLKTTMEALRDRAEELEVIIESLPGVVFMARDPECRHIDGNFFAARLLRLDPGANMSKSAPEQERPSFRIFRQGVELHADQMPVQVAARTGQTVGGDELDVVFDDGDVVTLAGNAAPLLDALGRPRGAVATFVDVSARRKAEQALQEALARLEATDRSKSEFIAVLSHELRNPLAPIRYAIPVLRDEPLSTSGTRAVSVIDRQVSHLARLVDDLLDVGRISSGKIELRKERVVLAAVVKAAVERAAPAIARGQHSLEVRLPEDPIWVEADEERLSQVITNLLDNAAKYSQLGGHIEVNAGQEDGMAVVRVRDRGMGIPPSDLERIFEMFHQVPHPGNVPSGLGIGLALVRRLVELHGGTVSARSGGPGAGSEFLVRLPLAEPDVRVPEPRGAALNGPRRLKVLVVDDNADTVEMLGFVVEAHGHEVRKALDGRAALSAAESFVPDVVLLDLGLPGMSGFEVATELRRRESLRHAKLVAMTGWGQEEDKARTREAGFNHHLTKPTLPDVVARLLAEFSRDGAEN